MYIMDKVDYNYFKNYKNYLLNKYSDSSPEILNFINDLYYLPVEHNDDFNKIKYNDEKVYRMLWDKTVIYDKILES